MKTWTSLCCVFLLCLLSCNKSYFFESETQQPKQAVFAENGMVVTTHPLASKVGLNILQQGGNAIDAAVAIQFALAVVYPVAGNIGGGGFMVYRDKDGNVTTLDFRETAPLGSSRDMYLDDIGSVIPKASTFGHLSVGVPGTVDGCVTMHKDFGSLLWEDLLSPAIALAEGYSITDFQANYLNRFKEKLSYFNPNCPFVKDEYWKKDELLQQNELAETLTRIKKNKRNGFYTGVTASLLLQEMKKSNGIITQEDLDSYQSVYRNPVSFQYKDYTLHSMPPPSSGGIVLAQILKTLEQKKLKSNAFHPKNMHFIVEAEKRAYADRAIHMGDPEYYNVPIDLLLDASYLASRSESITPKRYTPSATIAAGEFVPVSEETTHFSVVDQWGNAVSITTTLNGAYGSKVMVDGAGFLLNNEMDDFAAKPGVPNQYGLVGAEANSIAPGKRMLSSMTPTIVEQNNELFMVVGTPGGSTIITSVLQCFLAVSEYDMTMQKAVNLARYHHQWLPDSIYYEENQVPQKAINKLQEWGHPTAPRGPIGRVNAILVTDEGIIEGAADPRGDDTALGF